MRWVLSVLLLLSCSQIHAVPAIDGSLSLYIVNPDTSLGGISDKKDQEKWEDGDFRIQELHHEAGITNVQLIGHKLIISGARYFISAKNGGWHANEILGIKVDKWIGLPVQNVSIELTLQKNIEVDLPIDLELEYSDNASGGHLKLSNPSLMATEIAANVEDYFKEPKFSATFHWEPNFQWSGQIAAPIVDLLDQTKVTEEVKNKFREWLDSKREEIRVKLRDLVVKELSRESVARRLMEQMTADVPHFPIATDGQPQKLILTQEDYGWKLKYLGTSDNVSTQVENEITAPGVDNKIILAVDKKAINQLVKGYILRQGKDRYVVAEKKDSAKSTLFLSVFSKKIDRSKTYDVAVDFSKGNFPTIEPWMSPSKGHHFNMTVPFTLVSETSADTRTIPITFDFGNEEGGLFKVKNIANANPAEESDDFKDKVQKMLILSLTNKQLTGNEYAQFSNALSQAKFLGDQGPISETSDSESRAPELIAIEWAIPKTRN